MNRNEFRASGALDLLGFDVPLVSRYPLSDDEALVRVENQSLRRLRPFAQQAHFALLRGPFQLDMASAFTALRKSNSDAAQDTYEEIETIIAAHGTVFPDLPRPRMRGVAALGVLRIDTDTQTRELAMEVLRNEDLTSYAIYQSYEDMYSGYGPDQEVKEVERLLKLGTSAKIKDEANKHLLLRMRELEIDPFHLQVWKLG